MRSVANFRDCGGYRTAGGQRVRTGLLFRSGHFDRVRSADRARLRVLGVRTMVDLRPFREQHSTLDSLPDVTKVTIPFDINSLSRARLRPYYFARDARDQIIDALASVYSDLVEMLVPQVGELFDLLLDERRYPLVVHCRAGKDRTGFACALVHRALGVPVDTAVQDYLKSNDHYLPRARRGLRVARWLTLGLLSTTNLEIAITAREQYIEAALGRIEAEYGGVVDYLARCGIDGSAVDQLRGLLLEKP